MKKFFVFAFLLLIINAFFDIENFVDARRVPAGSNVAKTLTGAEKIESEFQLEVLRLVNIERQRFGLNQLTYSAEMEKSAMIRAREIVDKFSHTRPDGTSCFTAVNVSYSYIGENIAAGQVSPQDVVTAWMNSEGHRANILNSNFSQLGVGYLHLPNTDYKHYWVQIFRG